MNSKRRWIEVIEVRSPQGSSEIVRQLLHDLVDDGAAKGVDVFRRASLEGDFLVQVEHNEDPHCSNGSALGVRIAAALRQRGMVNHSVWMREPVE